MQMRRSRFFFIFANTVNKYASLADCLNNNLSNNIFAAVTDLSISAGGQQFI